MTQRRFVSSKVGARNGFLLPITYCVLLLISISVLGNSVRAEEPAEAFVNALRDNGYYDLAIKYLTDLESSSLVDERFRKQIPLEKAETLIQSVNRIRDLEKWESRLNEAQKLLTSYAATAQDPLSISKAQLYQANLSYRRARVYTVRSESDRLTASEKEAQLKNARQLLNQALSDYVKAKDSLRKVLDGFEVKPEVPGQTAADQEELRRTYITTRLRAPIVRETLADTFPDEEQKKELLTTAAKEFSDLWDKYYKYPQGLDSCLYAARTHLKLKEYNKALTFTEEIFALGASAAFRTIKRKAALIATECWRGSKPYPIEVVINTLEPMIETLNRRDRVDPEWLEVQLELAKAYRARADELKTNNGKPSEVSRWNSSAAKLARSVSRSPSAVRDEARELLTKWKIKVSTVAEEIAITSFDDAKEKARELATELETSLIDVSRLRNQIASSKNPEETQTLQGEFDEAFGTLTSQADATLSMLQRALTMIDASTVRDDINFIRYMQCFCYYASDRFFEATIIGEFLLDRYPSETWTQQAAGLVIKSYRRLYDSSSDEAKTFEGERLSRVCNRVIDRWPGSSEAVNGASIMANLSVIKKDYDEAQKFFATIPADDPSRSGLALRIGQGLWFAYRGDETKDPKKLDTTIQLLQSGVEGLSVENLNYNGALGSLLLVEAHLAKNEIEKALERLESAKIAPLDLIKQKHPAIFNSSRGKVLIKETYKTALKSYMSAMQLGEQAKWISKAQGVLQALKQMLADEGDEGRKQLVRIYKLVAFQLNSQFASIQQPEKKSAMAKSLSQFLSSLGSDASDGRTVLWAGSTILEIADQLNDDANKDLRKSMYSDAEKALSRAANIGFKNESDADQILLELKRLKALALRGAGRFEAAVDLQSEVLKSKPNFLEAQLDAAETLQMWGKSTGLANAYAEAMGGRGKYRDEETQRMKKLIWGWRQLVQITNRKEKYVDVYYQCYHGQIETMLEYGLLTKNQKALSSAKKEMTKARSRDPEFGGKWKTKFEALEKRIGEAVN